MAPKASGMNNREGGSPARRAIEATAGISTAVAAMLFMKADRTPLTSMSTTIRRISLLQRGTDDEDRQHGDDRGRREPGESLARCEVAAEDENDQTEEGRQVDRQLLGQEEIDHRRQEGEEKGDLRRHQGHCSRSGRISQHA
jgi:hypothetical protein